MMRSPASPHFFGRALCLLVVATAFVVGSGPVSGQQQASVPDVETLGPQVGTPVPDFSLSDQHGVIRTLESLMGPQGLMLVFSRSADW